MSKNDDVENSTPEADGQMDESDETITEAPEEDSDDDLLAIAPPPLVGAPTAPFAAPPNPSASVSARVGKVADNLRTWARKYSVADDPYVTALSDAIDQRGNLTAFATSNPLELLPVPNSKRGRALSTISRFMTVVRNVLVFAPVLLTWLAISRATEAFGRYTDELRQLQTQVEEGGAAAQANFLEFWQSGGEGLALADFEPLDDFWRLTDVAELDALIIAVVIALTFVAGLFDSFASSRRRVGEAEVEKERTRVAVSILEGLQGNRSIDNESLEETLAFALNDLSEAARDVNLAAERLETASVGVSSLTPRIIDLTSEVTRLSDQFSTDVQQSIQTLTTAVSTLGSSLEGDLQQFMTDVLTGLEDVVDKLKSTAVGVEYGTKQLRDDLDAIHQRLANVVGDRNSGR